jgi:hypothetical protein
MDFLVQRGFGDHPFKHLLVKTGLARLLICDGATQPLLDPLAHINYL